MNPNNEVGTEEEKLLNLFQKMTGSEKERKLTLLEPLKNNISALRRTGLSDEEKLEIINRILALMGSGRICSDFLTVIFGNVEFSNIERVEEDVDKFRCLCLLQYADFKDGFEIFRKEGNKLRKAWDWHFSSKLKEKKIPLSLTKIPVGQLYHLGYLAYNQYPNVEKAREKLREIFKEAEENEKYSREAIEELAIKKGEDLFTLWANAGISEVDDLIESGGEPSPSSFRNLTRSIGYYLAKCEREQIEEAREKGKINTIQYLSTQDIDVYVATSMRKVLDFSMNAKFIEKLMNRDEIKELNLTFFDPTQSYLPDRIQKGLLENIMVERALVTIYNAQESDTFGKDAEAGISHAFGKPVIVYVTRLFSKDLPRKLREKIHQIGIYEELQRIYSDLDSLVLEERDAFLKCLKDKGYLTEPELKEFEKPDKDKKEAIEYIIDNKFSPLLNQLDITDVRTELIQKGYEPPLPKEEVVKFCVERIKKLEGRALLFQELHPLTFQISPIDGIARGVFVTRSVDETAKLLRAILKGKLEYEITPIKENNIVLRDKITHSPIRVYPNHKTEEGEEIMEDIISDYIKKAISDLRSHLMSK
jgi:hypothetical protein